VNYPSGYESVAVAVGDFNGDGKPDLAVSDLGNDVSILLGKGDGTFEPAVYYGAGSGPETVAVGDFNGDGKLDLATPDFYTNSVGVLLGKATAPSNRWWAMPWARRPTRWRWPISTATASSTW